MNSPAEMAEKVNSLIKVCFLTAYWIERMKDERHRTSHNEEVRANRCEGDNAQHDVKAEGCILIIEQHMPHESWASIMLAILQYL